MPRLHPKTSFPLGSRVTPRASLFHSHHSITPCSDLQGQPALLAPPEPLRAPSLPSCPPGPRGLSATAPCSPLCSPTQHTACVHPVLTTAVLFPSRTGPLHLRSSGWNALPSSWQGSPHSALSSVTSSKVLPLPSNIKQRTSRSTTLPCHRPGTSSAWGLPQKTQGLNRAWAHDPCLWTE